MKNVLFPGLFEDPAEEIILGWIGAVFSHLGFIHWIGLGFGLGFGLVAVIFAGGLGVFAGVILARRGFGRPGAATEARRQWARRLADASFDGLLVHRNGTVLQINAALVRMLGYREVELLGTQFSSLAQPAQVAQLRTELEAPQPQLAEFVLLDVNKTEHAVEMASHTLEIDGLPVTVTAIRDLTAQQAMQARLAHLMHSDPLTGLANRAMLTEKLQEAMAQNDIAGGTTAMLTLRLERLKAVNDQLGRIGGDNLLRQVAGRLRGMVDERDTLARLSGNQFGISQPHSGAPNRILSLTSEIGQAMDEPFIVEGKAIRASMAIGVAIYPEHAIGAEGLINASGFALSKAIEKGGIHSFSHAEAIAAGFTSFAGPAAGGGRMPRLDEQRHGDDLRLDLRPAKPTLVAAQR